MGSIVGGILDLDGVVIEVVLLAVVPLLEWINSSVVCQSGYDWDVAALTNSDYTIGNSISNSRAIQFNGQADLIKLYNKIPYLKRINQVSEHLLALIMDGKLVLLLVKGCTQLLERI